jgi:hypothetical protein
MKHEHHTTLPLYRSHKLVRAARITGYVVTVTGDVALKLAFGKDGQEAAIVPAVWLGKRVPPGVSPMEGMFVVYNDGYTSWSPVQQFLEGNKLLPITAQEADALASGTSEEIDRAARELVVCAGGMLAPDEAIHAAGEIVRNARAAGATVTLEV